MRSVKIFKDYREQVLFKEDWAVTMGIVVQASELGDAAWVLDSDDSVVGEGINWEQAEIDLLGKLGCM